MKQDIIQNIDALEGINALPDHSIDLLIADPPYGLGKERTKADAASVLNFDDSRNNAAVVYPEHVNISHAFL